MSNIREIAKKCNLSVATVSRYINNNGKVSNKSKIIIEEVIKKMDYVPNEHARALFKKKTKVIGMIFPDFMNPYFGELAMILGNMLQEADYKIMLYFTEDNVEKELNALRLIKGYKVDGLIVARACCKEELSKMDIPIVSFETKIDNVNMVLVDNYKGGQLACKHLLESNCKNLLHIRGPLIFEATQERYRGFITEANKEKVNVDVYTFEENERKMRTKDVHKFLSKIDFKKYDGVFTYNDIFAGYLYTYLQTLGLRIPEDIKIVGFDNSYLSKFMNPKLTTLEQSAVEVAKECYDLLIKSINTNNKKINIKKIPINLIVRESTGVKDEKRKKDA